MSESGEQGSSMVLERPWIEKGKWSNKGTLSTINTKESTNSET